jgi:hypothetical protein
MKALRRFVGSAFVMLGLSSAPIAEPPFRGRSRRRAPPSIPMPDPSPPSDGKPHPCEALRRGRAASQIRRRLERAADKRAWRRRRNRWLATRDPGLAHRPPPARVCLGPAELTEPDFDLLGAA